MHRDDFLPASTHSRMRRQFDSIGKAMEQGIGKSFFAVDAVLGTHAQVLGVYAGAVDEVQRASWPLADRRTNVELDVTEPFDVLVWGNTFKEALARAERYVGRSPRILVVPEAFRYVGVHLYPRG